MPTTPQPSLPRKPRRPPHKILHARPLPLQTYPLPAVIPHNPLTLLRVVYVLIAHALSPPSSHPHASSPGAVSTSKTVRGKLFGTYTAYYDVATRSVHVTDAVAVRALWEQGFFGKGSLSRSEPEWMERAERRWQKQKSEAASAAGAGSGDGKSKQTSAEVTNKRREERREEKRQRARREAEAVEEQLKAEAQAQMPENEKTEPKTDEQLQGDGALQNPKKQAPIRSALVVNGHADARGRRSRRSKSRKRRRVRFRSQVERIPPEILPIGSPSIAASTVEATMEATMAVLQRVISPPVTRAPALSEPEERLIDQEHLQLNPTEAFFLAYGLGILTVVDPIASQPLSISDLLGIFRRGSYFPPLPLQTPPLTQPDDPFLLSYVVYHHFRSLGWVVRPGVKFAVDFLLYNRGPVFSHAEFAVLVLPSYSHPYWTKEESRRDRVRKKEEKDWWWLHCANRVQSQVRKSLVLVYVDVPPPSTAKLGENTDVGALLRGYKVREFVIGRWSMNRNRD